MPFTPVVIDPVVDLGPFIAAYAAAFQADSNIGAAGVYIGAGEAGPQASGGKRIGLIMRGNPEYSYGEGDVRAYLDVSVTTEGRDTLPTYAIAAAVQRVALHPTALIQPAGYKPIRTAQVLSVVSRDPPPEAGRTVRVLLVSFTMLGEKE
jgi:hypothetical protein